MIFLSWSNVDGQIGELMRRYNELPRSIAKKHLVAAMKRAGKNAVPILKKNTPKAKTRTSSRGGVVIKEKGGALRRAATFKAKYKGRNADGAAIGILGYKAGMQSRKAIWLEFGTKRGIEPRRIVERTMPHAKLVVTGYMVTEMAKALEKAAREMDSPMNPRMSKAGIAAGIAPQ